MAEFASIPFFEQTGLSGQQEIYSPYFDVAMYGQIVTAFKVVAVGGTTPDIDVDLEHSMDMDQWASLTAFTAAILPGLEIKASKEFARYVRAKVTTMGGSLDATETFSLLGIARDLA